MNTTIQPPASATFAEILPIVDAVVAKLSRSLPPHVSAQDLASAGKVAVIEVLRNFKGPADEARYYCVCRVRGAILDELRKLDPLSRSSRAQVKLVRKAVAQLEQTLGRVPSDQEVAGFTGLSVGSICRIEQLGASVEALPLGAPPGSDFPSLELSDPEALSPAEAAEHEDTNGALHAALARLPGKEALVLRRSYLEGATLETIARELGVSTQRAQQLRQAGEKRLRADLIVLALWQGLIARRSR